MAGDRNHRSSARPKPVTPLGESPGADSTLIAVPPARGFETTSRARVAKTPYRSGVGEDGVTAFTHYGIECLKQIIADERAAGNAPSPVKPTE